MLTIVVSRKAMELRDVAARGVAPRGSIYHHFPGGKAQLAAEAATLEGEEIRVAIERSLVERGLGETFRRRVVSTVEGALVRARAAGDQAPSTPP